MPPKKGYNFITLNTLLQTKIYTYEIDVYGSTHGGVLSCGEIGERYKVGRGFVMQRDMGKV